MPVPTAIMEYAVPLSVHFDRQASKHKHEVLCRQESSEKHVKNMTAKVTDDSPQRPTQTDKKDARHTCASVSEY